MVDDDGAQENFFDSLHCHLGFLGVAKKRSSIILLFSVYKFSVFACFLCPCVFCNQMVEGENNLEYFLLLFFFFFWGERKFSNFSIYFFVDVCEFFNFVSKKQRKNRDEKKKENLESYV